LPTGIHNAQTKPKRRRAGRRRGLSLLEVILAIAILAGCIAAIGELVRLGLLHAEEARDLTNAQLLCESKIAEIAAGVVPAEAASMVPFEHDSRWMYSVVVNSLDDQSLLSVQVTVQPVESTRLQPLTSSLTCWMIDPSLALMEEEFTEPTEEVTAPTTGDQATSSGGTDAR
jgi:type II secretion system protein I